MPNLSLYDISENYLEVLNGLADYDLPEDAIADTLEAIQGEFDQKAIAVAKFFQNLEASTAAIKEAEKRMADRRKAMEKKVSQLKDYLKVQMEKTGITKIECPQFSLSIAKNPPSVVIDDAEALPQEYVFVKIEKSPDKTAIKNHIILEGSCPGAHVEQGTRLVIK